MIDYPARLTYGSIYIVLLLAGLWLCVFRHPKHPHAYARTGTALVVALLTWIARPVLMILFASDIIMIERISGPDFMVQTIALSFFDSLLTAIPIALMTSVVLESLRDGNEPTDLSRMESDTRKRFRWFLPGAIAIVTLNLIMIMLAVTIESGWYRVAGAAPYLLFLTCGALICLLRWRRIGASGLLATAALIFALLASYVQPWLARQIHLLSHGRTWQYNHYRNNMGYEYGSGNILERTHLFVSLICESVPVLLLAWAVFRLPELSVHGLIKGNDESASAQSQQSEAKAITVGNDAFTSDKSPQISPKAQPIGSPPIFANLLAMFGWGLSMGIGNGVLFIAIMLCYMLLIEDPAPTGHGALGITPGYIVLIIGIIPAIVLGLIIGIVIAAKRARG